MAEPEFAVRLPGWNYHYFWDPDPHWQLQDLQTEVANGVASEVAALPIRRRKAAPV